MKMVHLKTLTSCMIGGPLKPPVPGTMYTLLFTCVAPSSSSYYSIISKIAACNAAMNFYQTSAEMIAH